MPIDKDNGIISLIDNTTEGVIYIDAVATNVDSNGYFNINSNNKKISVSYGGDDILLQKNDDNKFILRINKDLNDYFDKMNSNDDTYGFDDKIYQLGD